MTEIWKGQLGPPHWLCPYHMTIWQNEQEYANHMQKQHSGLNESRQLRIIDVDVKSGIVTLSTRSGYKE